MVSRPTLVVLLTVVGIGAVAIAVVYTYSFNLFPQANDDTLSQEQQQDGLETLRKGYSKTIWAQTGTTDNGTVSTTLWLTMCDLQHVQQLSDVAGYDEDNPIVLKRDGQETKVEFCVTSHDPQVITWYLTPSDANLLYDFLPDYEGALAQGVNVTLDKAALQIPAYTWNRTVSNTPDPPYSDQFTAYISADKDTKLGPSQFHIIALRHVDNETAQVQNQRVHINVVK